MEISRSIANMKLNTCQKEHNFISKLSKNILKTADVYFGKINKTTVKSHQTDIFSEGDTELDTLIVKQISQAFPQDVIVSEESTGHMLPELLRSSRGWIIDPLCGSTNFARHIRQFATNIILVENKKVKAAWVVDHPNRSLIWSVGGNRVFVNATKIKSLTKKLWLINMDQGYWSAVSSEVKRKFITLITHLMKHDYIIMVNQMTSLAFAYVATGQFQAAITPKVKPWDLLAACFIVEQNGGVVTHFDGSRWGIDSTQIIMGENREIYNFIYRFIKKVGLKK